MFGRADFYPRPPKTMAKGEEASVITPFYFFGLLHFKPFLVHTLTERRKCHASLKDMIMVLRGSNFL